MIHHILTTFFLPYVAFINDPVGFTQTFIDVILSYFI